ncbi:MAG TPA: glycosyltransferase, partial [Acidimicrobiales bacterium]|nr:glycosyltransferase [Acidimicrobiales bacterium]
MSAVLVSYNSAADLPDCLRSLRSEGVDDVVVVDNASADGSVEVVGHVDPDATVVQTGANLGFGTAANRGVAVTTGDHVLIQDADLEYDPEDWPALLAPLLRGRAQVVYGSRFLGARRTTS